MNKLLTVLDQFSKKKILVVGDVMLDKYTIGSVSRISPEAPVPVLTVEKEEYKPGGAANVAINVSSLSNSKVVLFGFVGEDPGGFILKKVLEKRHIQCYFESNSHTIIKERIMGKSSGQQQQMVRIDREKLNKKYFQNYSNQLIKLAKKADKIILSDYGKGTVTLSLMNLLKNYKDKIILDPKPSNKDHKIIYKDVFLMTPNRKEALEMSGCKDIIEAGKVLREEFNSNILITVGKEGAILFPLRGEISSIETIPRESFEETGAGDTSIATLSLAITDNSIDSLIKASKIANYASGITINHIGAYSPTFDELKSSLQNETSNIRTA